jgi:hypothetical protein
MLRTREECNFAAVAQIAVQEHCTLEAHLAKLAQLRDQAQAKGDYGAAISAEYKRGQALGFYIERKEQGTPGQFSARTREEADKQLEEVVAKIAAKQAIQKAQQSI